MGKTITNFVCQECGYDSPAYLGKCPECGNWNSMKEFRETQNSKLKSQNYSSNLKNFEDTKPLPLSQVRLSGKERIQTGFAEMDTVLGGGIVLGSAILLAGDPGIGKSTLLLQLALRLAAGGESVKRKGESPQSGLHESTSLPLTLNPSPLKVLYISAEESVEQVSMRAIRVNTEARVNSSREGQELGKVTDNLLLLSLTDTDLIVQTIESEKPDIVIIDSIQTVESQNGGGFSGSVSQVRYATTQFIRVAKTLKIPIIMVGHVTKEGMVAGPMVLSHMVDTVLFLEGEKLTSTRILRSFKNRFGPVDEVGVFQMVGEGMVEVKNPEQIFLGETMKNTPGSSLVVIMEGSRPFLIEIQALVVYSKFPMPRRVASGIDSRRLELLLAVLQKHCRLPLETYDVFVNIAGGIKVTDRAVDLGVCLAVFSSLRNFPMDKTVGIAEVGLLGELRKVGALEKRIREAKKLGFEHIITPDSFRTLSETLNTFGLETKQEKAMSR